MDCISPVERRRMIVGISGATGIVYGLRLLDMLRELDIETHLVVTKAGERTLAYETDIPSRGFRQRSRQVAIRKIWFLLA